MQVHVANAQNIKVSNKILPDKKKFTFAMQTKVKF